MLLCFGFVLRMRSSLERSRRSRKGYWSNLAQPPEGAYHGCGGVGRRVRPLAKDLCGSAFVSLPLLTYLVSMFEVTGSMGEPAKTHGVPFGGYSPSLRKESSDKACCWRGGEDFGTLTANSDCYND